MKTINGWTKESLITFIESNFNGQSLNTNGDCVYRGLLGAKCAVGMFIPENKYTDKMEGDKASEIIRDYCLASYMPLSSNGMLALQDAHDLSSPESCLTNMLTFIQENVE